MKKKIVWLCLVILMIGLVGCKGSAQSDADSTKEQTESQFQRTEEESETKEESEITEEKEPEQEVVDDGVEVPEKGGVDRAEEPKDETVDETMQVAPSLSGALRVEGTKLVDSNGNPVQLRGISTHGLSWFPQYVNQELFHELHRDWNANVMRLAMYTAENGGYCTDGDKDNLKKLVQDGVQYATNADMYVIIDWHVLRDENPNANKEEAKKFFDEMAEKYADADNVIYEICNEPNGSTTWAQVKEYALEIIPVIRAHDEDAVIIVGTPTYSQDVDKAAEDPITEYDNIMYSLHFYATTHTDWLRDRMNQAVDGGLPIFVSEFGTCDASGSGAFDEYQSNEWIKALDAKGISYVTWNLSNKNETSSIFADGCTKTSGFTQDDLSQNGKWIYALLRGDHRTEGSAQEDAAKEETEGESREEAEEPAEEDSAETVSGESNGIKYVAKVTGTWESDGKTCYQYTLDLENVSGEDIEEWEIKLTFSGDITFSDGWNGDYSVSGKQLTIGSKDYNGALAAGGKTKDIGFIISGEGGLELE